MTSASTSDDRFHRRLFAAAVLAWIACLFAEWLVAMPLNHDEAALAISARRFLDGLPRLWLHRPLGMNAIAAPGVLAGGSEHALRLTPMLIALAYPFAVRRVGRPLGLPASSWAVAILIGTAFIAYRAPQLLSDLPSTICVLMAIAVLATELDRPDGPRWRLLAAAPWLAAAFYVRYASLAPIGVLGLASIVVWPRAIARRPLVVLATIALFALLLVPHLLDSIHETGSPLGVLRSSVSTPRKQHYLGEGLVTYLTANPLAFYGGLAPLLALVGLASIRARSAVARRPAVFLWLIGVGQVVLLGFQTHAQARYVAIAVSVLCLLGADALVRAAAHLAAAWQTRLRRGALAVAVGSWLAMLAVNGPLLARDGFLPWTAEAARLIRAHAAGRPCLVVASHVSQVMWYSGCRTVEAWWHLEDPLGHFEAVYHEWEANVPREPSLESLAQVSPPVETRTVIALPWLLHISSVHPRR